MSLRRRLLLAMLIAIAALAASAGAKVYKAEFDAPKLSGARALMPASAESTWLGSRPANKSDGRLQLLRRNGRSHEPSLVPIQFKDAAGLGPGKLLVASRGLPDPNFAKTVVLLVHYDEKGVL